MDESCVVSDGESDGHKRLDRLTVGVICSAAGEGEDEEADGRTCLRVRVDGSGCGDHGALRSSSCTQSLGVGVQRMDFTSLL